MKFGEFVKKYRKEHGMSQRTFAKICGISNGYISMIEKGENPKTHEPIKPSLEMLRDISSGIGITLHELLSQIDDIDIDISLQTKAPAPESGLEELISIFREMSPDNRSKFLELGHLFLSAQDKKEQI